MMKLKTLKMMGVVLLAGSAMAGEALAQAAQAPHTPNPNAYRTIGPDQGMATMDEMHRRSLSPGKKQIPVSQARLELANKVATLLNQGQCNPAYDTAMAAHDLKLAARVSEICTPKS